MNNVSYVFFIHTPYQSRVVIDIVLTKNIKECLVIIEGKSLKTEFENRVSYYIKNTNIKTLGTNIIDPRYLGIKCRRHFFEVIESIILEFYLLKYPIQGFFISDINWPINNYFYFRYKASYDFYLFEEGIGNYIATKKSFQQLARGVCRWALSFARLSPPYVMYLGECMGGDQKNIKKQYFYSPELSDSSSHKVKINKPISLCTGYTIRPKTLVFLDQPYTAKLCEDLLTKEFMKLSIYCDSFISHNLIKPHHFSSHNTTFLCEVLNGRLISETGPIEDYHFMNDVIVCSYNSSALFNIKLIFGEKVRCISILFDQCSKISGLALQDSLRLKQKLRDSGVEFL